MISSDTYSYIESSQTNATKINLQRIDYSYNASLRLDLTKDEIKKNKLKLDSKEVTLINELNTYIFRKYCSATGTIRLN